METISQSFASKIDEILKHWKIKVRLDTKIENSKNLSEPALTNLIPEVLEAMTTALNESEEDDFEIVAQASLEHGINRFEHGYDAAEIAREYRLLRQVVFSILKDDLLELPQIESYRAFRIIDAVIDQASAYCFHQFVEERTRKLENLQQQITNNNEELTRLLSLSQDSFSQLAHELKTPLNSIMAYSQMILRQQQSRNEEDSITIERIERVLRASRQLLQLVNNSLEISQVDAGKTPLKLMKIDLNSVIAATLETIEPLAEAKELSIIMSNDLAPDQVITDLSRFQQILINLLSNAVRYTETGSITIICESLPDDKWLLGIRDTGIGIAPENIERIFQPFSRVAHRVSQQAEGSTGLGLTIVSQIVELLQGEIQVISQLGEGSEFIIIFPREIKSDQP
ncbi:HAMP domain-containing histidine kinase [Laspinema sp. D1]|uniref:ATP-binding protein n=1 Tax=Laspinema palackyanum TaxID=3231601 RepID=UPI00348AFA14|nr:HAMP domain-containing histidine kinase [Laspinema sp. D2b]